MRHEFTRHCVTLGSALLLGLAATSAEAQAPAGAAAPKQKALISFDSGVFARWKRGDKSKEELPAETTSQTAPELAEPAPQSTTEQKALLPPNSIFAREIPAATSPAVNGARQAAPTGGVTPLPPTSLVFGQASVGSRGAVPTPAPAVLPASSASSLPAPHAMPLAVQPIATALPPGAAQAQLTAGQLPFSQAQTPVVIMVPAGWQPDGAYTFAPRTVMSPEVPAEHWPTSQRNPFGDDSKHGLFNWPQIAKKITSESLGEQQKRAPEPAAPPTNTKALFATAPAPAPAATSTVAGAAEVAPTSKPLFAPASPTAQSQETRPASKALFGPAPQEAEPEPPAEESRALFSLFTKSKAKSGTAQSSMASKSTAKPLFAFGKKEEEATAAPAPEVVPQYAAETPMPPSESSPSASQPTIVGATELEEQPPLPPSVSNATPAPRPTAMMSPVKSDDPKMKWRAKGTIATVSEPAGEVAPISEPAVVKAQVTESVEVNAATEPAESDAASASTSGAAAVESQVAAVATVPSQAPSRAPVTASQPVARDRSLFGNLFRTSSAAAAANELASDRDMRGPWRRQAERDAAAAEEKAIERPVTESKAILPQVAALLPALDKPERGSHHGGTSHIATAAATEDGRRHTHSVQRAHTDSARTVDSYYAPPREYSIEAELEMTERQQMGGTSSGRRAAVAQRTHEPEVDARVPFEAEEPEEEDAADRPAPPVAKRPTMTRTNTRTRSSVESASSTGGAKHAPQRSSKGYRRLTGDDIKKGFTRPFAFFAEKTKLPTDVAEIASGSRHEHELHAPTVMAEPGDVEVYEFYDEPEPPVVRKRSAPAHPPVYELRQSTAPAASVTDVEDSDTLRAADEEPVDTRPSQRSGRRRVEAKPRTRSIEEAPEHTSTDVPDELPGVATTQIRNKHGVKVLIYTGEASTVDGQ